MKKLFVFLVRLVNVPGAIAVVLLYEFGMYRSQRSGKDLTLYRIQLRNVLLGALPWVSFTVWAFFFLVMILKQIFF